MASNDQALFAVIGDEDSITGFLLAGVGNVDLRKKTNFLLVNDKTPTKDIEDAFKSFTAREDIAIVLINQHCANMIGHLLDVYTKVCFVVVCCSVLTCPQPVPAVLEIPSKDKPYDPSKDSILAKVKMLVGME